MAARLPLLVAALAALLALAACTGGRSSSQAAPSTPSPAAAARPAAVACGTNSGRGCAPAADRVDLERPSFSNPTEITNPLFPIGSLRSALFLGHVDGKPFRTETTLLPGTKTVAWEGRQVRVLVSQYAAYLDGRLQEVALDRYAQADDGSVWYLGEDVFDYENGAVAFTEGTWLAGREGPAAMIMPAHPEVGDVYRTENAPGIVFEEVTVSSVGQTVDGPRGPVAGAMVARELHADGTSEDKIFAPGYGEFRTGGAGGDLEALALAVPADALAGPPPAELQSLAIGATATLEASQIGEWETASAALGRLTTAWKAVQTGTPPLVETRMTDSVLRLSQALQARKTARTAQAAIDVAQSALDLELRYRPAARIDEARFELETHQLRFDAAAGNLAAVTGDVAVLEWIRDRFAGSLGPAGRREVDVALHDLRAAVDARNLPAAADHAARLGARLRDLTGSLV